MIIKNKYQRKTCREAAKISTEILHQLFEAVKAGVVPIEIDELAFKLCRQNEVLPGFYGVPGRRAPYQHATCIQVNDEVVHSIPDQFQALKPGDLMSVDFGIVYDGFYTDHCFSVGIEPVAHDDLKLLQVGRQAILSAARLADTQHMTGDLGYAIMKKVSDYGFDTAKDYIGHGIGKTLHEYPELPSYGRPHTGTPLEKGMLVCVEAQVLAGEDELKNDPDGWTVRTKDGSKSVMFEYMVEVDRKAQILTPTFDWPLTKD